jgi:hypothetical protein
MPATVNARPQRTREQGSLPQEQVAATLWERTLFASPLGPNLHAGKNKNTAISGLVIPGPVER